MSPWHAVKRHRRRLQYALQACGYDSMRQTVIAKRWAPSPSVVSNNMVDTESRSSYAFRSTFLRMSPNKLYVLYQENALSDTNEVCVCRVDDMTCVLVVVLHRHQVVPYVTDDGVLWEHDVNNKLLYANGTAHRTVTNVSHFLTFDTRLVLMDGMVAFAYDANTNTIQRTCLDNSISPADTLVRLPEAGCRFLSLRVGSEFFANYLSRAWVNGSFFVGVIETYKSSVVACRCMNDTLTILSNFTFANDSTCTLRLSRSNEIVAYDKTNAHIVYYSGHGEELRSYACTATDGDELV